MCQNSLPSGGGRSLGAKISGGNRGPPANTRATVASAAISCRRVSVCPSITSRCSTETAKRTITQITPDDIAGTLVF